MKHWPFKVFCLSYFLAPIFRALTSFCSDMNVIILLLIIILVIFIGIIFDMIGVATLTSKESSFHAMSSKKNFWCQRSHITTSKRKCGIECL